MALVQPLDLQISQLRAEKIKKDSSLVVLRPMVEEELKKNTGFLDELELMMSIFRKSNTALIVWGIWFTFLFGLEMFILVSKLGEPQNDYDAMVDQQKQLHLRRIELLGKQ